MLGYNYPGDIWYRDAYRLLTSKGLRPIVAPSDNQSRLPRLLPWGKHKETTAAPPAVSVSDANQGVQQPAGAAQPPVQPQPPPPKPAKKTSFWHDILGL